MLLIIAKMFIIVGNNDHPLKGFMGQEVFGIKFCDKYEFEEGGRRFGVIHGDQYDKQGLIQNNLFMSLLSICQDFIERTFDVDVSTWWTGLKLKKRKLRRVWDILKWNNDVDVFIMGHSHCPEVVIWVNQEQAIKTYANSGDWVSHKTFIEINDGILRLKKYEPKEDSCFESTN